MLKHSKDSASLFLYLAQWLYLKVHGSGSSSFKTHTHTRNLTMGWSTMPENTIRIETSMITGMPVEQGWIKEWSSDGSVRKLIA